MMTKTPKAPETDDARASDTPAPRVRREKLESEAKIGFREAMMNEPDASEAIVKKASSSSRTAAEGMTEDGEGASPMETAATVLPGVHRGP